MASLYESINNMFSNEPLSPSQITTGVFAAIYAIIIVASGIAAGGSIVDKMKTILVFTFGAAMGWLVAGIVSPHNAAEKNIFETAGKTLSAFVTGYLFSKVDKIIQTYIDIYTKKIQEGTVGIVLNNLNQIRLIGLVISFVISVITVYVFRSDEYAKHQRRVKVSADSVEVTNFDAFIIRDSTEYKKKHLNTNASNTKPASQTKTNPSSQSN
ncbi:hypothetical protein [Spirosoma endbachense]|uniref:Uncharacterized protein n=1 Tax=Spirosoma endbachense TaxID=2666025 RepID=A0A6P1W5K0_9BACT|nr:hypothetical protein [Spirosoma endbachense]QHV99317.1 hypothetical protein GJR95_31795 [Spirosoma endbachense]